MRKTVFIYSDVAGHFRTLNDSLIQNGVVEGFVPEDKHIIFNGDLVHKGNESEILLYYIDTLITNSPNNVTVLMGNHEAVYHPTSKNKFYGYSISDNAISVLHKWFANGVFKVATGVRCDEGDFLITHAGLTYNFWKEIVVSSKIQDMVQCLNSLSRENNSPLWRAGEMMTGIPKLSTGPLWSSANFELYPSWLEAERNGICIPLGQVHGHTSLYNWDKKCFRTKNTELRNRTHLNYKKKHTLTVIGHQMFIGSDPDHTSISVEHWSPVSFYNARVFVL